MTRLYFMLSAGRKTQDTRQPDQADRSLGTPEVSARITFRKLAGILAALFLGFVLLQSTLPLQTAIQIGADEGFELAKATLCLHGHKLYAEVWNDQPPLHTFLITQILKHLSPSILGPRLMSSLFAALLLTSIFIMSLRVNGLWVAGLTTAMVIASPGCIELSSSCMLEIPALAPAVAALCLLLVVGHTRWPVAEVLSGILFGFAFQTKLVNVILLPLAALIIWHRHRITMVPDVVNQPISDTSSGGKSRRTGNMPTPVPELTMGCGKLVGKVDGGSSATIKRRFPSNITTSLLILAASLSLSFATIDCGIDRGAFLLHFQQSWVSHFAPTKSFEHGSPSDHSFDWNILIKNWDLTIPAIFGIIFALRQCRKTPAIVLPVAWLALTLMVLAKHKPWGRIITCITRSPFAGAQPSER